MRIPLAGRFPARILISGILLAGFSSVTAQEGDSVAGQESVSFAAERTDVAQATDQAQAEQLAFFENRIRPLLDARCLSCHGEKRQRGGLRLDARAGWERGGDNGSPIVAGDPDASRLIRAVRYEDPDLQMPPKAKLSAREIADLERWIRSGAHDPRVENRSARPSEAGVFELEARKASHWAWRPVTPGRPPEVRDASWPRSELDRFVLARLEALGLEPAPEADRAVWLRRVHFALTGLPPTPEDVDGFLGETSPRAHETVVEGLLASPHFGETWGQHWLDLVRFAETRGHEQDFEIPEAWRYRDYVVRAFNEDVPYNQLVREHVAGDLLPEPRIAEDDRTNQSIQGTGFWHLGEGTHSPVDIRGDEADRVHNALDVFSKTFLGLSVGCARCHDHKFDAIAAADYYALYGYLQSSSFRLADVSDPTRQTHVAARWITEREAARGDIAGALADLRLGQLADLETDLAAALGAESSGESARVSSLRQELSSARDDASHALHAAAMLASDAEQPAAALDRAREKHDRALASVRVTRSIEDGEKNIERRAEAFDPARHLVEDFDSAARGRWIPDGHRFGPRPARPGEMLLGVDRPIERICDESAAETELMSRRFSGKLRTRTFEVIGDTLWYRHRGSAEVFLAVDSHRVVAGPLHGVVKRKIEGDPRDWKWSSHPTRDYLGHRVHVEFDPQDGFAIDRVLFADRPPPLPSRRVAHTRRLLESSARTPESIARKTVELFREVLARLRRDTLEEDDLPIAGWLLDADRFLVKREDLSAVIRDRHQAWLACRERIERDVPTPILALALLDGNGEDEPVHIRGNHRTPSSTRVPRAILAALRSPEEATVPPPDRSGRLELAERLVDPSNPLVARVFVNRVWHHLFGRGLVASVDDFGVMGQPPSHPELLDHLTARFVEGGWSLKGLVRELVLSSTWRQSSHASDRAHDVDPTNVLLSHMSVRRLPAEAVRDTLLAISGRLDRRVHGPSVRVHISESMRSNRSPGWSGPLDGDGRRSLYTEVRRNHLPAMLLAFDKPIPFMTMGRRSVSNCPAQPLVLLNDPFVHEQAQLWSERLLRGWSDRDARIRRAYAEAFARSPREAELRATRVFLDSQMEEFERAGDANPEASAWQALCHTLFNVKELIFLR